MLPYPLENITMIRISVLLVALALSSRVGAQMPDSVYSRQNYDKAEYQVTMRDGVKLFTAVYTPKDKSRTYTKIESIKK